jgi:ABC-2 type transport system permease protein
MVSLLRAEWTKQFKNYKLAAFLVWIFPIGVVAALGLGIVISLVMGNLVEPLASGPGDWRNDLLGAWGIITAFPVNIITRILPLAFIAVAFAGEYEWGTWKNLIPRNRRPKLVLAKLAVPVAMVMISLCLTSVLLGIGSAVSHRIGGQAYGPALSGEVFFQFLGNFGREFALALASLLLLGAFAALGAILTRSILGALLVSFGFSLIDLIGIGILSAIAYFLKKPEVVNLLRFTPNYSLENIRSWLIHQVPAQSFGPAFTVEPSLVFSLICLAIWLAGLVGLAIWLFQRQDITG